MKKEIIDKNIRRLIIISPETGNNVLCNLDIEKDEVTNYVTGKVYGRILEEEEVTFVKWVDKPQ